MTKEHILTFRVDSVLKARISSALGSRYPTRTRLIRSAIEELLARESQPKPVIPVLQF